MNSKLQRHADVHARRTAIPYRCFYLRESIFVNIEFRMECDQIGNLFAYLNCSNDLRLTTPIISNNSGRIGPSRGVVHVLHSQFCYLFGKSC